MNRKSILLLLAGVTVVVVAWFVSRPSLTPKVAVSSEQADNADPSPSPALAALGSVAAVEPAKETPNARLIRGGEAVATGPTQPGMDGKSRTVRIVRVKESKYPLLRVEETADAPALVMVAEHCIVKKPATQSDADFRAAVARRGFNIRKKMLAPDTYLIAFTTATEAELIPRFPEALRELSTLGGAEPDYIVEAFGTPNDAYQHLLWGMHNVTAHIAVTGSTNVYTEGGKMSYAGEIPAGGITAALINCARGKVGEFPPEVNGQIALIERGDITFAEKATNAKNAGAVAALIYNNAPGGFSGTLSAFGNWLPVVPLTQSAGQALLAALPATVTLSGVPNGKDISARTAWDTQTGSTNVLLGVIDTGIDYNHPDLTANIWINPGEIAGNGLDDDGNGFVDDVHGWDFVNDDSDPMDDNNHGTHCAGTIGGVGNNAVGVVGVNWRVRMAALKFLDAGGSGYISDATDAVYYGTRIGARLTSNSWGGGDFSFAFYDALEDARTNGVLFVAAAGNSSTSIPSYPASYDHENVISVAATDSADQLASFSNFGVPHVDLAAPGVEILSSVPLFNNPPYKFFSGTSMACPHVAGAAALLIAQAPSIPLADLKGRLLATVDPVPALTGKCVTGGRLNVAAALAGLSEWPVFTITATTVSDAAGNNDGVINPGETISLVFTVHNGGYQAATNVTATFSTADAYTTVTDSNCTFGTVAPLTEATALDPVALTFAAGTPVPHTMAATLTLRDAAAQEWVLPVTLRISTTHHLSGTVTLDGAPLAGATVTYAGMMSGEQLTDGVGNFDLAVPIGDFELQASYNGAELSKTPVLTFTTPGDHSGIAFALTNATISGTVFDHATGSPVTNATVTFLGPVTETVTTAAGGTFALTRVYGRAVAWQVSASQFAAYDYPSSAQTVTVPPSVSGLLFRLGWPSIGFNAEGQDGWLITLAPSNTTTRTLVLTNSGVADLRWQAAGLANGGGTRSAVLGSNAAPAAITTRPEGSAFDGQYLYWLENGTLYKQDTAGNWLGNEYLPELIVGFQPSWRLACHDGRHFWFEEQVPDPNNTDHRFLNLHAVDLAAHAIVETIEVDRQLYVSVGSNEGLTWSNARCGAFAEGVFWFYWAKYDLDLSRRCSDMARVHRTTGKLLSYYRLPDTVNYLWSNYDFTDFTYANNALWVVRNQYGVTTADAYRRIYKLNPATGTNLLGTAYVLPPAGYYYELQMDDTGALWAWNNQPTPKIVWRIDSGDRLWLTANQTVGEIPEGQNETLTITFDSSLVSTGIYHGAVRVSSSDPHRPQVFVPVVFNVTDGTPGNNPPTITGSAPISPWTMNENTSQRFAISNTDPDGDTLTRQWALDGRVVTGTATSYVFAADYFSAGAHALAVRVHDGKGGVAAKFWQIQVNNVNRDPVASDATYLVANTDPLAFTLAATDPDNEELTWTILTTPASGTLSGTAPNFVYTPAPGFLGPVTLTFKVNDGTVDSNTGTVTINVGYRDVDVDTTPLVVNAAHGEKPTRTVTLRNVGTTPLRWALAMTWSNAPAAAGTVLHTLNSLELPAGTNFASYSMGLVHDGTNLLSSALELTGSGGWYRGHLLRWNPLTGALVGPSLPAPTSSNQEFMWMRIMGWSGDSVWALNDDWVSDMGSSRIHEFGIGETNLTLRTKIFQLPGDFGGYNTGVAASPHGLWLALGATYGSAGYSSGGVYRIAGTLDKTVLDRFDPRVTMGWSAGPIAYWNGTLWLADGFVGGPLRKLNPFTGELLASVPLFTSVEVKDMTEDHIGGMYLRDNYTATRFHSGDYVLLAPFAGYLDGGTQTNITVTFDTALAGPGTHTGYLRVFSNDPDEPEILIPYTFTVTSAVGNNDPTITLATPDTPLPLSPRQRQSFAIVASDPDTDPLTYRWYVNGARQMRYENQTSFTYIAPAAPGLYTIRSEVADNRGGLTAHTWAVTVPVTPLAVDAVATPARGLAPLAVDFAGIVSGGAGTNGAVGAEANLLVVEAENYHRKVDYDTGSVWAMWWPVGISDYQDSVGDFMTSDASSSNQAWTATAELAYDLQFPTNGTYYLWMRVWSVNNSQNSCWVGLNGAQVGGPFDDVDGGPHSVWRWFRHTTPLAIKAGRHTFNLRVRDNNFRVDRFIFTTDPDYIPTGHGPLWENLRLPAVTYNWAFGDGTPGSTNANPAHTYANWGYYLAAATVDDSTAIASDTVNIVAQRTYANWAAQNSAGAATANPDGDAYINLLEFLFSLNPFMPDRPALYAGGMENGQYVFRAELSTTATGVTTEWQTSLDLKTWSPAAPATTEVLDLGDRERFTFRFNLTPGQNRLFLRLKATAAE